MRFAFFIFTLFPLLGQIYVMWRTWHLLPSGLPYKIIIILLMLFAFACLFINFSTYKEKIPIPLSTVLYEIGTSWLIILLYLFMLFFVLDIARLVHLIPSIVRVSIISVHPVSAMDWLDADADDCNIPAMDHTNPTFSMYMKGVRLSPCRMKNYR